VNVALVVVAGVLVEAVAVFMEFSPSDTQEGVDTAHEIWEYPRADNSHSFGAVVKNSPSMALAKNFGGSFVDRMDLGSNVRVHFFLWVTITFSCSLFKCCPNVLAFLSEICFHDSLYLLGPLLAVLMTDFRQKSQHIRTGTKHARDVDSGSGQTLRVEPIHIV